MNDRLDRIMDRGQLEAHRDAEYLIREVIADRRLLTADQIAVLREIKFVADRALWDSLKGGGSR
jgi:hypothetical protein